MRAEDGELPEVPLSGITGTVQSAKLSVFDSNDATNNGPAVYRADSSWTESGITWANRPARTAGPSDNKVAIAEGRGSSTTSRRS